MNKIVGVDIGATNTRIALFDNKGKMLKKVSHRTDPKTLIQTICNEIDNFSGFGGIGVGSIGPLDLSRGMILKSPNINVDGLKIVEPLQKRFKLPCFMFNDCVAGVMAEKFFGAGKSVRNLVYITLSTGIGAGAIIDNNLLLGKDGNAHEVGHITIDFNSKLRCSCEKGYGHWETFCGGKSMPAYIRYLLKTEYKNETSRLRNTRNMTAKTLFDFSKTDKVAAKIVDNVARMNSLGIANVVAAYDPQLITIGGSIMLNNREILLDRIREWLEKYSFNRMPRVVVTPLGDDICLLGAAAGVLNRNKIG